jgi:hypothetical protein
MSGPVSMYHRLQADSAKRTCFINAENQLAVEVIESNSSRDLRLGESMRDLCSNWNPTQYKSVSNTNLSSGVSARRLLRRSA